MNSFHYSHNNYGYNNNYHGTRGMQGFHLMNSHDNEYPNNNSQQYWCETCDRDFRNQNLLENHRKQHEKCNIDGCQFVAHPKVITKHIQMQHSTGLYKKISKLNDPEEIKKWREERKKRYPTKANIDKKEAQIKEKIDRGEKMGLRPNKREASNNYSKPDLKRTHQSNRYNRNQNKQSNKNPAKKRALLIPKADLPEMIQKHRLKPFAGIQDLVFDSDTEELTEPISNFEIDDDDIPQEPDVNQNGVVCDKPSLCKALSSLINDYGSSDDDMDHKPAEVKVEVALIKLDNNKSVDQRKHDSDNDSGPEEVKLVKAKEIDEDHIKEDMKSCKINKPKQIPKHNHHQKTRVKSNVANKYRPKPPSTLLHKLLANEVRHERNIVLQCIRYIVQNKYFESS